MEPTTQNTNPSNEVELFDQEQFGNLINLPKILLQNRNLATKALAATPVKSIELTALPIEELDAYEKSLQEYSVKLKTSYDLNIGRRKPFTGFFDSIREKFTAEEKRIVEAGEKAKAEVIRVAKEKKRRIDEEEEKKLRIIEAENARIEEARQLRLKAVDAQAQMIAEKSKKMSDLFYADIDKFEKVSEPDIIEVDFGYDDLNEAYLKSLRETKSQLRDRIPSRRREVAEIKAGNEAAAKAAREREIAEAEEARRKREQAHTEQIVRDNTVAEAEKLNATFDAHAEVTENVSMTKGTKFKKKYEVVDRGGYVALLQWWLQNVMPTLSMDDLAKKLNFTVAPANDALNKGEAIEAKGIKVVDDVKTRITK